MSELKPKRAMIEIGGEKYGLLFDLNAIDDIQDELDIPISMLSELMRDEKKVFKVLKTVLSVLINEYIDDEKTGQPHVDPRYIGRKIMPNDIGTLKDKIFDSFAAGAPEIEENPTQSE